MSNKTHYKNLNNAFAGFTVVCERASRGDYRGALAQLGAAPEVPPAATVVRDALNLLLGEVVRCRHKFVEGREVCVSCGWRSPIEEEART